MVMVTPWPWARRGSEGSETEQEVNERGSVIMRCIASKHWNPIEEENRASCGRLDGAGAYSFISALIACSSLSTS